MYGRSPYEDRDPFIGGDNTDATEDEAVRPHSRHVQVWQFYYLNSY